MYSLTFRVHVMLS